jgi:hydroxymethylbilane synthase
LRHRPDLAVTPIRGNVDTRIAKLAAEEADGLLLALSGLRRLGRADAASEILPVEIMLPAVGQGALAIEARAGDAGVRELLSPLHDASSAACVTAERAMLAALDGSCRTPIAGHARIEGGNMLFHGMILRPDGSETHETARRGPIQHGAALAADAAGELKARAGPGFFDAG